MVVSPPASSGSVSCKRASVACASCRKGKARCVVDTNASTCQECQRKNRQCVWVESNRGKWVRPRRRYGAESSTSRPSAAPPSHTARQSTDLHSPPVVHDKSNASVLGTSPATSSTSQDSRMDDHAEVVDLYNQVHFKVDSALFPLGVLAEASRQIETNSPESEKDMPHPLTSDPQGRWAPSQVLGIANTRYFHGDIRQQLMPRSNDRAKPSILVDEIITAAQAEELFDIYFELLNPQLGLLDARTTSPQSCCQRSPFLFMAICAVAARFYRGGILYNVLLQHARRAGLEAMLSFKSTATVQGFVILATWFQPSVSYETDNAYLYAGIAIRIGVEIGLHRKTVLRYPGNMDPSIQSVYTGEVLSRERTWFCVFVLDRSMSALTGKPPQAPETFSIREVDKWWRRPECILSDVFISASTQLLRLLYRCFDVIYSCNDTVTATSTGLNYEVVVKDLQWRLDEWAQIWAQNLKDFYHEHGEQGPLDLYLSTLRLLRSFYNLVPLSFGLHHCTVDGFNRVNQISFVTRCYECAVSTLNVATLELNPKSTFKAAPDISVVAVAYAACFLLKLIGPEFRHLFNESSVLDLVRSTASLLDDASEDEKHVHSLYSLFLRKHLSLHRFQASSATSNAPHAANQEPTPVPSFLIANPIVDLRSMDVDIDLDGSVNFTSTSGTEVFRSSEDVNSGWMDSVLGF